MDTEPNTTPTPNKLSEREQKLFDAVFELLWEYEPSEVLAEISVYLQSDADNPDICLDCRAKASRLSAELDQLLERNAMYERAIRDMGDDEPSQPNQITGLN